MSFNVPYADMNYATFDDIQGAINLYQANQTPWYIPNDGGFLMNDEMRANMESDIPGYARVPCLLAQPWTPPTTGRRL